MATYMKAYEITAPRQSIIFEANLSEIGRRPSESSMDLDSLSVRMDTFQSSQSLPEIKEHA